MATILTDNKHYSDIAAAIRDKLGETKNFKPAEMAAAIEAIKTGAENVVEFTAPKGRMKGDVDGDGYITQADYDAIYTHINTNNITDEVALWCADVNANGSLNLMDYRAITSYLNGDSSVLTKTPTMADYYSNWIWFKVDDLSGYFYYDVPVSGMTFSSSALLLASAYSDCFIGVECMEGIARIKAERLPLAETDCLLVWEADGTTWSEADGGYKTVNIDIPLGRMKGDVDGDGKLTIADKDLISSYVTGTTTLDAVAFWCADVDNSGGVDVYDGSLIAQYEMGNSTVITSNPTMADYYGNWTYLKVDDTFGYFYKDIPIEGMTANSTAILAVQSEVDCFDVPDCFDGYIRIKAIRCPIANVKGTVLWKGYENKKSEAVKPFEKVDELCTVSFQGNDMGYDFLYQPKLGQYATSVTYYGSVQAHSGTLLNIGNSSFTVENGVKLGANVCITAKPGETCTITFT